MSTASSRRRSIGAAGPLIAGRAGSAIRAALHAVRGRRPQLEARLQHLIDHDPLTGLYNRRRFEARLSEAIRGEPRGALLVVDLDHFRYVNDSLGTAAGDRLLAEVAGIFRGRLRRDDVLARLGGDEFAVLLPGADLGEARMVASRLLQALRQEASAASPLRFRRVSASIGATGFSPGRRPRADELLVEADIAMFDAKSAGRDRVTVYDAAALRPEQLRTGLTWAGRIRSAIDMRQFVLHAQPILALSGDPAPRHELLIRMVDDDGSAISPATFLGVAERFDLVQEIDCWVLREAIRMLAAEQRAGHDIRLNVNLSAKSLASPTLSAMIANQLDAEGADGRGLCLEITETAAIVSIEEAKRFASEVAELGCEVALDDFGSGFASFYHLKHLDFDYLKIDGEFIAGLAENRTNQLVVQSILEIARGLGKRTIAEFVGEEATLDLLRAYGVDYAQGYHVARPAPCESGDLSRVPLSGAGAR